jgi:DNA-binding IclR family transcriptional regulator
MLSSTHIPEFAWRHLRAFAREVRAAVSLGCREPQEMVHHKTILSVMALKLDLSWGRGSRCSRSLWAGAYLAVMPLADCIALIAEPERSAGPEGHTQIEAAWCEIERFAKECCFSLREWHDDVNAVPVPFRERVAP